MRSPLPLRTMALTLWLAAMAVLPARGEEALVDLSQTSVALTATFEGSEILVFGAVRREAPPPPGAGPLEVIVTVQGPVRSVIVRRKARRAGIWMNVEQVRVGRAPSFYAVASSAPLERALSSTEDVRHAVSIPRVVRAIGAPAALPDAPAFTEALIRLRSAEGLYQLHEGTVVVTQETLFRSTVALPANLTEGFYTTRVFLTRDGRVIDMVETAIDVRKAGLERWMFNLAQEQPLLYGLLAVALAVVAGWGASAAFRFLRS